MSTTAKNKQIEEIKRELFSEDDIVVMKAVHKCREDGSKPLVEPLIAVYASTKHAEIRREIADLLGNLKVSGLEEIFTKAISNKEYKAVRRDLLSFIWNSGIQPVDAVVILAEIAVEGSFEEALECVTIVESIEDPILETDVLEACSVLRSALSSDASSPKKDLWYDMLTSLESKTEEL